MTPRATFDLVEDGEAGETDPERFVVSAGQPQPVGGAGGADQPAAPLAVMSPHHEAPLQVAAGAGRAGVAGLQHRGELPAGRLASLS